MMIVVVDEVKECMIHEFCEKDCCDSLVELLLMYLIFLHGFLIGINLGYDVDVDFDVDFDVDVDAELVEYLDLDEWSKTLYIYINKYSCFMER